MQIHQLNLRRTSSKKRIGRGGKRGTYSGRGNKGQKARSGGNVNPLFEGGRSSLTMRMKKARGFNSPHPRKTTITLTQLDQMCADGDTVNAAFFVQKGVVNKMHAAKGFKIVARGTLAKKKLTIDPSVAASAGACAAIEKAGGSCTPAKKESSKEAKKTAAKKA